MKPVNPLESVYFLSLPENFNFSKESLHLDPTIPLPVQKKDGDSSSNFDISQLKEEQILAGLLAVMAYDSENKNILYYRSILAKARPNLKKELTEAAILKTKNQDYELAEEIFASLRGFDPEDIATVLNTAVFFDQRADSYRNSGLTEDADAYDADAIFYYKQAMENEPAIPDAFFNAAFYYLKKRLFKEAKSCLETYLALTCDTDDEAMGENGIYKKNRAQELLDEISNQNLEDESYKLAYDFINKGEVEKGLEQIHKFLEKNPEVWNAWFMLGWGLRQKKRYADAILAFEKALSLEGGQKADTYNELAICYMEQDDLKKAKSSLEKALALENESTKIISNLGYLALKEGNTALAASYFQTVLEFDPEDRIAACELAKLDV
ncbi:tetratricopeptide repeat protein [Treponema pectinovorum]|uniref:tetratricopeptide repeat protein n=1 Tax=Treponema pectinovorum TaxID=164 RepID=UPI0011CBA1ED|nr:tetratricopeptide repeat protein [Treponema pectinovorum]